MAMRLLAKWHVWLGWIAGPPLVMWTLTGLVMVARPIEEVRGNHLRKDLATAELPPGNPAPVLNTMDQPSGVTEIRTVMQRGRAVTLVTRLDGSVSRHDAASGILLPPLDADAARAAVAAEIVGGGEVASARLFTAEASPLDLRRPVAAWQVALADGTHVYVARQSGEVLAVRTRFWRLFDVMWGLHIMDLETREDTHHPVLIAFAALGTVASLTGAVLLFRRRKRRVTASP